MELGPRDRLSQAFWHEKKKGRTIDGPHGAVVHLDLRHLGEKKLRERLPQIYELAEEFLGVDPAHAPIPVLPAVHYTMGGILADGKTASPLPGLYSVGECSSVGIHGANRLGSNSLTELIVFGKVAGDRSGEVLEDGYDRQAGGAREAGRGHTPARARHRHQDRRHRAHGGAAHRDGQEHGGRLRHLSPRAGHAGHLRQDRRTEAALQESASIDDHSKAWNTEWLLAIELGYLLDVAQAIVYSAINRKESRGSHQRLDGFEQRDDVNFLKHTLAYYAGDGAPRIAYGDVKITKSKPGTRAYGAAGEKAEEERKKEGAAHG